MTTESLAVMKQRRPTDLSGRWPVERGVVALCGNSRHSRMPRREASKDWTKKKNCFDGEFIEINNSRELTKRERGIGKVKESRNLSPT